MTVQHIIERVVIAAVSLYFAYWIIGEVANFLQRVSQQVQGALQ